MKNILVHTLFGALAAAVLMAANVQAQPLPHLAQARLDVPVESPGIPLYMRLGAQGDGWQVPGNADWTVIVFYRDPACIPNDFDLADALDLPGPDGLGAFACPLLVEGFDLRFETLDPTMPPEYMYMRNSQHDFPIWFVSTRELDELLDRGFVYIDEIEALPSRVAGRGWQFEEQLTPYGFNPRQGISMSARGRLATGGQFSFFWYYTAEVPDPFDQSSATVLENVFELQADLPTTVRSPRVRAYECVIYPELPGCRD